MNVGCVSKWQYLSHVELQEIGTCIIEERRQALPHQIRLGGEELGKGKACERLTGIEQLMRIYGNGLPTRIAVDN